MINLLVINNFYPVILYRPSLKEKESDELLDTVRSLVMVRNQLSAQVVNWPNLNLTQPKLNLLRWNDVNLPNLNLTQT